MFHPHTTPLQIISFLLRKSLLYPLTRTQLIEQSGITSDDQITNLISSNPNGSSTPPLSISSEVSSSSSSGEGIDLLPPIKILMALSKSSEQKDEFPKLFNGLGSYLVTQSFFMYVFPGSVWFSLLRYPLVLAQNRVSADLSSQKDIVGELRQVVQECGSVFGVFRGVVLYMVAQIVSRAVFRSNFLRGLENRFFGRNTMFGSFFSFLLKNIMCELVVYPLFTITLRMQLDSKISYGEIVGDLKKESGLVGLYDGVLTHLMISVWNSMIARLSSNYLK